MRPRAWSRQRLGESDRASERAARIRETFSSIVRLALSITRCSRSQRWYSLATTSAHVGIIKPGISDALASTLRRCSSGAEHLISTSIGVTQGTFCHVQPSIASQPKRIDRISNYCSANAEIIFGDRIGYPVANVVQGLVNACPATNGLLYGVDAQVHSADLARQFPGDGRLANPGQPAEDNQTFPYY